jgi:hypothetical protein
MAGFGPDDLVGQKPNMVQIGPIVLAVDESDAVVSQRSAPGVIIGVFRQMQFPSDFHRIGAVGENFGNVLDIRRYVTDILSLFTVSSGGDIHQPSVLIEETGRQPVYLGLNGQDRTDREIQTSQPFFHFVQRLGLPHGQHRNPMPDLLTARDSRVGDADGGEIRVFGIDITKSVFQFIELDITHQGRIGVVVGLSGLP